MKKKIAGSTDKEGFYYRFTKEPVDIFLATLPYNHALDENSRKLLSFMFVHALEANDSPKHIIYSAKKCYFEYYGMYSELFK